MRTSTLPLWRTLAIAGFVLALLLGAVAPANAALSGCRADPVFVLSDGTVLDVQVAIETNVGNLAEIHYVVHGPIGTKLVTALSTPTLGFQGLETVTYIADAAPRQYITDTRVELKPSMQAVGATSYTTFAAVNLSLRDILRLRLLSAQYRPIEGFTGQHLIATLNK